MLLNPEGLLLYMKWTRDKVKKLKKFRKQGLTYTEIAKNLGTTIDSIKMKIRRLGKKGEIELEKHIYDDTYTFDSIDETTLLKGLMIWWCEGTSYLSSRRYNRVEIVNSDPRIIYLFMQFLRKLKINEEKIKLRLKILKERENEAKEFWSRLLNVPLSSFDISLRPQGYRSKRKSKYGVLTVKYNSQKLAYELHKRVKSLVQLRINNKN